MLLYNKSLTTLLTKPFELSSAHINLNIASGIIFNVLPRPDIVSCAIDPTPVVMLPKALPVLCTPWLKSCPPSLSAFPTPSVNHASDSSVGFTACDTTLAYPIPYLY